MLFHQFVLYSSSKKLSSSHLAFSNSAQITKIILLLLTVLWFPTHFSLYFMWTHEEFTIIGIEQRNKEQSREKSREQIELQAQHGPARFEKPFWCFIKQFSLKNFFRWFFRAIASRYFTFIITDINWKNIHILCIFVLFKWIYCEHLEFP